MTLDARRLIRAIPGLRPSLMLLRRVWRDRRFLGAMLNDFRATRREAAFLRIAKLPPNGRLLNLLTLDDDSVYGLKLMAFVAQGLRLRGWTVQVVLRNRAMVVGKAYFNAFGIYRFVYLDDIDLSADEREFCTTQAARFLGSPITLQLVKNWSFEGCWIGPQIIATLSRLRFEGMIDFKDPQVRLRLKGMLAPCLEHVLRARKLVRQSPADVAMTIEANYAVFGPLVDMSIAHGTSVIQMIQPWQDDGLIFRRLTASTRRDHPSSVAMETLDRIAKKPWTDEHELALQQMFTDRYSGRWFLQARNQQNSRRYSTEELRTRFALDASKPIVVVFSQVLWDANLFYGDDLFEDAGHWFVETVRAACANSAMNWLIKLHPANVWKRSYEGIYQEYAELALIRREIGDLPAHVKVIGADDDVSTMSLFQSIDIGVTVRGTSGMELVCFGKHCVTAGTGRYSGLGFTLDSADHQEYLDRLRNLHEQSPMTADELHRAKWHAYSAFILRPWPMTSAKAEFDYQIEGRSPLDHNLTLQVTSIEDIDRRTDLSAWADWAEGSEIDYMHEPKHSGTTLERRSS